MESKSYTMDFAGRPLTLEFGRYCEQANGSVWVHLGDTVVHAVFGEGVVRAANDEWTTFEVEFADGKVRSLRAAFLKLADLPE